MGSLVIVESPTKARTLTRFLANKYCIEATIKNCPHEALISNKKKFGKIITNIIGRIKEVEDRLTSGKEQERIKSYF